jgi:hypothetical protein
MSLTAVDAIAAELKSEEAAGIADAREDRTSTGS